MNAKNQVMLEENARERIAVHSTAKNDARDLKLYWQKKKVKKTEGDIVAELLAREKKRLKLS